MTFSIATARGRFSSYSDGLPAMSDRRLTAMSPIGTRVAGDEEVGRENDSLQRAPGDRRQGGPMTSRRGHGEDSIYFDAAKARWTAAVSLGRRPDGTRHRAKVTGRTKGEVRTKLRELRSTVDAGLAVPDNRLTVATFLDRWLATLPGTLEPSTLNGYAVVVRLHLKPTLGAKLLSKLTVADVDTAWAAKRAEGYAPNYLRIMRATLRRALGWAERGGLVIRNVASLSAPPKLAQADGRSLTIDQAHALLAAARDDRLSACYLLMLAYGLRRGEALGLAWTDLDYDAGTLAVRQGVKRNSLQPNADGSYPEGRRTRLVLGVLKTPKSRRTLTLTAPLLDALRTHRARQAAEKLALGALWQEHGLLFPSAVGTPLDPNNFARSFHALCAAAGLGRWRPHEARHSAASIMLAQGTPLHVVSEVLGHSSIAITKDVYGHLLGGEKRAAAEMMTAALLGP